MEMSTPSLQMIYLQEFLADSSAPSNQVVSTNDPGANPPNGYSNHPINHQDHSNLSGYPTRPKTLVDSYYFPYVINGNFPDAVIEVPPHSNAVYNMDPNSRNQTSNNQYQHCITPEGPVANFNNSFVSSEIQYNDNYPESLGIPSGLPSKHQHTSSTCSRSSKVSIGDNMISPSSLPQYPDTTEVKKPKIQTVYWEDENTTCYQVTAKGFTVSRRLDNNYINGTKLLNVIGMTRGKRDGILKTEKTKKVVKVGSINLKGVWIPFERAFEIARNEGVDSILFPLFLKDFEEYFEETGHKLRSDPSELIKVEIPERTKPDFTKQHKNLADEKTLTQFVHLGSGGSRLDPTFRLQNFMYNI